MRWGRVSSEPQFVDADDAGQGLDLVHDLGADGFITTRGSDSNPRLGHDVGRVGDMNGEKGYKGPGICEYYLRTGDASVLPKIKAMTEMPPIDGKRMFFGGFETFVDHRG